MITKNHYEVMILVTMLTLISAYSHQRISEFTSFKTTIQRRCTCCQFEQFTGSRVSVDEYHGERTE